MEESMSRRGYIINVLLDPDDRRRSADIIAYLESAGYNSNLVEFYWEDEVNDEDS